MHTETWERLKQLDIAALELPVDEREPFVVEACKDKPELRDEILAMLRVDKVPSTILGGSVVHVDWSTNNDAVSVPAIRGNVLNGRFRIDELIGRGGMGDVYLASDLQLNRSVAIKTVRHELFPGEQLTSRLKR